MADSLQRHPQRVTAALAAVFLLGGGGAFAVANGSATDSNVKVREITHSVQTQGLAEQVKALEGYSFQLSRQDTSRQNDTADSLLSRLGVVDVEAAAFIRQNKSVREALLGTSGRTVSAQVDERQRLVSLTTRWIDGDEAVKFSRLVVERDDQGLLSRVESAPLTAATRVVSGQVDSKLFTAMDESPDAAQIFFSRGGDDADVTINGNDVQVNDRLKYLLVDRIWPTDDGDGMGQLLEGATIGDRTSAQAASLASQTMALIAENSGQGSSIIPGDDGWHLPEGARDSVGNILASYMDDVYRGAQTDGDSVGDNNWVWGDDPGEDKYHGVYGLRISHEDLGVVLQDVGRGDDKTGITTVITSALNYNTELTSDYIGGLDLPEGQAPTIDYLRDHNMLDGLTDTAGNNAQALSFLIDRGLVGGQDQEASDQEVRDAVATAFGAATEFVPSPQGKVAGYLTSEGLSFLQDKIGEQPDSPSQAWAQDTDAAIKTSLQYQTYNALLQHGYLNASDDPAYGIPPECLVPDGNGNMVINPKLYNGEAGDVPADVENAFNAWDSGRNPQGIVQDFINAYSSDLPNFR